MFKAIFETMNGIGIFPLISLIIFFTFFVVMLFVVLKNDKERDKYMSNLPLDDNNEILK